MANVGNREGGLGVSEIDTPHFWTRCELSIGSITLAMCGNADSDVKSGLEAVLRDVERLARVHSVAEVVVDLRVLYFMTSSCISSLVRWVSEASEADFRYRVLFRTNPSLSWQRRTLLPLCGLAPDRARVD
jgi:hypothetical protein